MRNIQPLNKYIAAVSVMLLLFSQQLFAACSSYVGLASINEVSKFRSNGRNHANDLVELKLLDTNIPYSVYSNWRIRICENSGSGCTSQISVSSFSDTTPPWLVLKGATLPGDYISFDDGFDIIFTDASGNTIDYLTYDGYQPQKDSSCFTTLPYDTASGKSGGGEKRIRRKPDGTGDWDFVTAQSTGDTEDGTNDDVPSDAPNLSVADITVAAGDTAVFTLTMDASYSSNITVDYETVDSTAISGVDYTGTTTTQTVTIPAGSTTATVSIPTASAGSGVFRLLISNASAAIITDQIAEATIVAAPILELHFPFDEGAGQSSADASGNGRTGTLGSSGSVEANDPTFSCEAAGFKMDFDGSSNQHIVTPSFSPPGDGAVAFWLKVSSLPSSRQRVFGFGDGWELRWESDDIMYFDINKTGSNSSIRSSSAISVVDTWMHIAFVTSVSNNSWSLYIDGVLDNSGSETLSAQPASVLTIGGSTWRSTSEHLTGSLEDFRIYSGVLNASEIAALAATPPADCLGADHFDIDHNGNAIYCLITPVTVTAEQLDNTTYEDYNGTITLNTNSGKGTWTLLTGTGSFDDATANDGIATYTYSNVLGADDNGVAVFNLYHGDTDTTSPLSINISVVDGGATDNDAEGQLSFAESGFTLTGTALTNGTDPIDTNLPVGTQISGKDFSIYLAAFGQTPTDASCGIIESYQGSKTLSFGHAYIDPNTNVHGTVPFVNGVASGVSSTVTFAQGQAQLTVNYMDAGQIQLSASDGSSNGSSGTFTVVPAGLCVTVDDMDGAGPRAPACAAGDNSCSVYIEAGESFNLNVTAKAWQASGESNTDFCDNSTTPNFKLNAIALTSNLVAPKAVVGGVNGSLAVSSTDITANGTVSLSETFSEVGVFTFTATPGFLAYFGETIAASTSENVGRFIPHHFKVVPSMVPIIVPGTGYHYLGQPFNVLYDIQAVALDNTSITSNYDGLFNFLNVDTQVSYGAVDTVRAYSFNVNSRLTAPGASVVWLDGVAAMNVPLTIERGASPDAPYTAVDIAVLMADGDGVQTRVIDYDVDTDLDSSDERIYLATIPGELRYGRVYVPPVYGPETPAGNLDIPFEVQYWNGTAFVPNINDSYTPYDGWSASCADPDTDTPNILSCADTTASVPVATVNNGLNDSANPITVTRPGAGKTGSLDITVAVDSWLQYDWDADGTFTDNPSARVTFGSYRGHDKIIYWREAE